MSAPLSFPSSQVTKPLGSDFQFGEVINQNLIQVIDQLARQSFSETRDNQQINESVAIALFCAGFAMVFGVAWCVYKKVYGSDLSPETEALLHSTVRENRI